MILFTLIIRLQLLNLANGWLVLRLSRTGVVVFNSRVQELLHHGILTNRHIYCAERNTTPSRRRTPLGTSVLIYIKSRLRFFFLIRQTTKVERIYSMQLTLPPPHLKQLAKTGMELASAHHSQLLVCINQGKYSPLSF